MEIVPEIGDLVCCEGCDDEIEVVSTNIGNSTFIGSMMSDGVIRQDSFLFSQIIEKLKQENCSQPFRLSGVGTFRVELSPEDKVRFLMAQAGEMAGRHARFVLGGTKVVKSHKEGS